MSFYNLFRHFADSHGLVIILVLYLVLCGWHFLPRSRSHVEEAKNMIFKEDDDA